MLQVTAPREAQEQDAVARGIPEPVVTEPLHTSSAERLVICMLPSQAPSMLVSHLIALSPLLTTHRQPVCSLLCGETRSLRDQLGFSFNTTYARSPCCTTPARPTLTRTPRQRPQRLHAEADALDLLLLLFCGGGSCASPHQPANYGSATTPPLPQPSPRPA